MQEEELNEMEEQGLIKAFEYTYELSWKTLQDLLKDKGYTDIIGPKSVIEQSFPQLKLDDKTKNDWQESDSNCDFDWVIQYSY